MLLWWKMRFVVVLCIFSLLLRKGVQSIPLQDFYPFGPDAGDSAIDRNDDGSSPAVTLSSIFPFFDRNFQTIFVNTNGAISFTSHISQYTPDQFPTNAGREIIAPFWADVDTRGTGTITYRETTNATLLQRANNHIKRAFSTITFSPSYLFIATWDHVGYFHNQSDKTNTFQAVLATDGLRSFVIFLYADNEIQWTTGDSSQGIDGLGGTPAQVGFDAGDGMRYATIPGSRTDTIINVTKTSNVGIPGVWIFRIDEEAVIIAGCRTATTPNDVMPLTLFPHYGSVLGGTAVQVFGPCFDNFLDRNITCSFDGVKVPGIYVDENSIICISPALTTHGRVDFILSISNSTVKFKKATFYSLAIDDASFIGFNNEVGLLYTPNETLEISWDKGSLLPQSLTKRQDVTVTVDIQLAEVNAEMGSIRTIAKLASNITNTGRYRVIIPSDYEGISAAVVQLTIASVQSSNPLQSLLSNLDKTYNKIKGQFAVWSREIYVSGSNVFQEQCEEWYKSEPDGIGDTLLQRLPPCPPTENRMTNVFVKEDYGNAFREFFHPSTSSCYRQVSFTSGNQGSGQQCCYDKDGNIVTGPPGGGTVDRYATNTYMGKLKHFLHDVLPYIYCCKGQFGKYMCDKYYERRPSDNGSRFNLQPPACVYGDPHLVTLDGYKYTFNGKGEFTLVGHKDGMFTLQGRMVEAENSNGSSVNATVFSAVAAKQYNSDTVQFRRSRRGLDALVNGAMINFANLPRQDFNNVVLSDMGNQTLSALFSSGAYIQAKVENEIISVLLVSLPDSFYNSTFGLMGVFNNDKNDDLLIKNSTENLPLDSRNDEIHWQFGLSWIINANDSLFTYSHGESWATYYDRDFIPSYNPVFLNPSLEAEATRVCGNDQFCLYDIAITGRMDIGLSTLDGSRSFDEIVQLSYPIVCDPPCERGACVANDTCNCAEGYTGDRCSEPVRTLCDVNQCDNGGRCTRLGAVYKCDCVNGYTGLLCQHFNGSSSNTTSSDNFFEKQIFRIIVVAAGGGLVVLVVMMICVICCCCCYRRRRRKDKFTVNHDSHANAAYGNGFLVSDKLKTDPGLSMRPLIMDSRDLRSVPAHQIKTSCPNCSPSQMDYEEIDDTRLTESPSYPIP